MDIDMRISGGNLSSGELEWITETNESDVVLIIWLATVVWVLGQPAHLLLRFTVRHSPVVVAHPDSHVSRIMSYRFFAGSIFQKMRKKVDLQCSGQR